MSKTNQLVAYKGENYTIEWYFDAKGNSPALEYYHSLKDSERIKLLVLLKRMGDMGEIKDKTKFIHEGSKIYAFKPQPHRFLCFFFRGKKIILTNGFRKKQQILPKGEKEKALKAYSHYTNQNR
jgi:phage-related protein